MYRKIYGFEIILILSTDEKLSCLLQGLKNLHVRHAYLSIFLKINIYLFNESISLQKTVLNKANIFICECAMFGCWLSRMKNIKLNYQNYYDIVVLRRKIYADLFLFTINLKKK